MSRLRIVLGLFVACVTWAWAAPLEGGLPEIPIISSTSAPIPEFVKTNYAVEDRLIRERYWSATGLRIVPYKPNYILPISYVSRPNQNQNDFLAGQRLQNAEAKFQLSFRIPVARGLFWNHGKLSFAYTQISYWQVYNQKASAPFRETNYEPEVILDFDTNYNVLGLNGRLATLGYVHQSNGRTPPLSRGWDRIYIQNVFQRGNFGMIVRPWIHLPDIEKEDNPDISHYMGNFELRLAWKAGPVVWSALGRNNLTKDNKGAAEFAVSFPLLGLVRSYVQFFSGYGESLLDYDHYSTRIGAGVIMTDWL